MEDLPRITDDETAHLATELASLTGQDLVAAVKDAVRERLRHERERADKVQRVLSIAAGIRSRMKNPPASSDLTWLYDDRGLPK